MSASDRPCSRTEYWASALIFFCFGVSAGAVLWGLFA